MTWLSAIASTYLVLIGMGIAIIAVCVVAFWLKGKGSDGGWWQ